MSEQDKQHGKGDSGHGHGKSGGHGGGSHHGGGGHEEHEGAPEWLISFADNVTLMMGFFVIMLAMNMKPATGGTGGTDKDGNPTASPDMIDAALAIREGFNNPVNLASTDPRDLPLIRRVLERNEKGFARTTGVPGDQHDVESIRASKYRELCGSVPFEWQSFALNDETVKKARSIAIQFKGIMTMIEVRGHCSTVEAASAKDHGRELCYKRAATVAAELEAFGIDSRQVRIVICGDYDRAQETAYSADEHARNQRVEVIFTEQSMPVSQARTPEAGDEPQSDSELAQKPTPETKADSHKEPKTKPATRSHH